MLYDQTISDTVSLSRVLDVFAYDNEQPEIVLNFLDSYHESIADIVDCSLVKSKLFSIDFLHRCSYNQAKWIADNFDYLPIQCRCDLAWQTADTRSGISISVLFMFKKYLKKLLLSDIEHPYRGRSDIYVSELDDMMFEAAKQGDITCALSYCSTNGFEKTVCHLHNSLFCRRILQIDAFNALNFHNKYILLKYIISPTINFANESACTDFLFQVFGTKFIDEDIKKTICSMILRSSNNLWLHILAAYIANSKFKLKDTKKLIDKAEHISSVLLNLAIQGEDRYDAVILYMLLMKKRKLLEEWIDSDPDQVKDNFDIVNILAAA